MRKQLAQYSSLKMILQSINSKDNTACKMTYTAFGGALNSSHSPTHAISIILLTIHTWLLYDTSHEKNPIGVSRTL